MKFLRSYLDPMLLRNSERQMFVELFGPQFGIIMVLNLSIGLCTPPVGTSLFIGCGIAETTVAKITPHLIKFFLAMVIVLMLCTYIPQISMLLPKLFNM